MVQLQSKGTHMSEESSSDSVRIARSALTPSTEALLNIFRLMNEALSALESYSSPAEGSIASWTWS